MVLYALLFTQIELKGVHFVKTPVMTVIWFNFTYLTSRHELSIIGLRAKFESCTNANAMTNGKVAFAVIKSNLLQNTNKLDS